MELMSTTAVMVLNTLARDEFERDWNGYEERLDFLQGDLGIGEVPRIEVLSCVIGGKEYSFPALMIKTLIEGAYEEISDEVEESYYDTDDDAEETVWAFTWGRDPEEEIAEKTYTREMAYWTGQLEGLDETMSVLDCRLHYLGEGTKEFVAYMEMLIERQPALETHIREKMAEVHEEMLARLESIKVKLDEDAEEEDDAPEG
jgi:hypothetical protein